MPLPVQEPSFSPKTPVKTEYFIAVEACLNPTIVFLKHTDKSEFSGAFAHATNYVIARFAQANRGNLNVST